MKQHLEIILNCVGDGITAISESQRLAKALEKKVLLNFPEGFSITIHPNSEVMDLVEIWVLNKNSMELNIEEKKRLYAYCEETKYIACKFHYETDIKKLKELCSPLFITSIDKVPIWEGDRYFCIDSQNKIHELYYNSETDQTYNSAINYEICEQWIADNRSISVKDIKAALTEYNKCYGIDGINENDFLRIIELKIKGDK